MKITFAKEVTGPITYTKAEIIERGGWWMPVSADKAWAVFIPPTSNQYLYLSSDGTLTLFDIRDLYDWGFIPCPYREIKITL